MLKTSIKKTGKNCKSFVHFTNQLEVDELSECSYWVLNYKLLLHLGWHYTKELDASN